jgi:16S rRNA (guanine527-N7)-methyltransferase
MPTLSDARIASLLAPYLGEFPAPAALVPQLSVYLDLLLKWNARTNLTAIREPEAIVQRHFGESVFAGVQLASRVSPQASVLDLGSGAGFPGLPIQLLLPELRVTLAESQNKKASFLREAVRTLGLPHTEVWAGRAEDLPAGRVFDVVTLRAVDNMAAALAAAWPRLRSGGRLLTYTSAPEPEVEAVLVPLTVTFLSVQTRP